MMEKKLIEMLLIILFSSVGGGFYESVGGV